MAEIRVLTKLRRKRDEIADTTAKYEKRLAQARADLSHINAGLNSLADIIILPGDHAMPEITHKAIAVVGIDIGKNSFHIVGHDERGAIVLR